MKKQLWSLAVGAVAGVAVLAAPAATPSWRPVPYGMSGDLLPATVSPASPVRVVSTALDADGRPVVTVRTATDRAAATRLVDEARRRENTIGVELDAVTRALGTDPGRSQQWDLDRIGVPAAQAVSTGAGVTVAVLDTGVDAAHPDLAGQVLPGYDAIAGTAGTGAAGGGTDPDGHGTHVAGTIAALTGNGIGVASTAPDARILPVRVLDADGAGYMSDAAEGIVWAADHGAGVVNLSLGARTRTNAVTNAVAYARSKGVVVVAAAGNERAKGSPVSYPAADVGVIAVAATDSQDAVASYSNRGGYVDVAAPGSLIYSTYPTALGGYKLMSGTSMAAPHVAAVAALIRAHRGTLTPDQVEQALESSAVDLGPAGRDDDFGHGRIDAASALTAAGSLTTTAPATTAPVTATPVTATPGTTTPVASAPVITPTTTVPTTVTSAPTAAAPPSAPTTSVPAILVPTTSVPPTTPPGSPATTPATAPARIPATTAPVAKPLVTLSPTTRTVAYRGTATATFRVTAAGRPYANRPAQLCLATAGWAFHCTATTTSATGTVTVSRVATSLLRAKLVVPGAATAPVFTAKVRVKVTATRVAAGRLRIGLAGVAGQKTQLQRLSGTRWVTVATHPAAATRTVSGLTRGARYRVVVPTTAALLGATSGVAQV